MLVKSTVDDSTLLSIKLEGTLLLSPDEGRVLLDLLSKSALSSNVVFAVGHSNVWTKLDSRWGSKARYGIDDSRVEDIQPIKTKGQS